MNLTKKDFLICIYSSHEDLHLAEKLRSQIDNSKLPHHQKNIIVLSDLTQKEKFHYDQNKKILYLKVKECYTHLSLKTELMIRACNNLFDFDFLIKWDASTLEPDRCYSKQDSPARCFEYLMNGRIVNKDYCSHLNSQCNGRRSKNWFMQTKRSFLKILQEEGRDLECCNFIPEPITYYRGKFYIISKKFCDFISESKECETIFRKNFQHNFGSEDMSVGMCFQQFKKYYDQPQA